MRLRMNLSSKDREVTIGLADETGDPRVVAEDRASDPAEIG